MTKLLTIDVHYDKKEKEIIYIVNVIANNQENILILADVINEIPSKNIHCIGVKLNHCFQHCYELLPPLCTKGQIFVKNKSDEDIDKSISTISDTIMKFIL